MTTGCSLGLEGWWLPARSVLVVDDDEDLRLTLTELLIQTGRVVFAAASGSEAAQLLDGTDIPRPCLILLDWRMHSMTGKEFLSWLHTRADLSQLSVVIVSGDSRAATASGVPQVVATLAKPFDLATLEGVLRTYG